MSTVKNIPLRTWAAQKFSPPPSDYLLRKWRDNGQIIPLPEFIGREYFVSENAKFIGGIRRPRPRTTKPAPNQKARLKDRI
ncbi:hypothetical protein HA052_22450 [Chromobacterium haemolyticum]|uniref:Excisionase-like domain-containing protein n=1 Tax=Chromobacterium fluminis TaxID=3044269 RepID=A0ABX0LG86_9NEIS|nr:hypothetical protein [Chromobacterium haemolyticum]